MGGARTASRGRPRSPSTSSWTPPPRSSSRSRPTSRSRSAPAPPRGSATAVDHAGGRRRALAGRQAAVQLAPPVGPGAGRGAADHPAGGGRRGAGARARAARGRRADAGGPARASCASSAPSSDGPAPSSTWRRRGSARPRRCRPSWTRPAASCAPSRAATRSSSREHDRGIEAHAQLRGRAARATGALESARDALEQERARGAAGARAGADPPRAGARGRARPDGRRGLAGAGPGRRRAGPGADAGPPSRDRAPATTMPRTTARVDDERARAHRLDRGDPPRPRPVAAHRTDRPVNPALVAAQLVLADPGAAGDRRRDRGACGWCCTPRSCTERRERASRRSGRSRSAPRCPRCRSATRRRARRAPGRRSRRWPRAAGRRPARRASAISRSAARDGIRSRRLICAGASPASSAVATSWAWRTRWEIQYSSPGSRSPCSRSCR